jgi:c-di-GMP-binding flagellar brake protein YcgR
MNEIVMLRWVEPKKIIQTVISLKIPAIMSYMSKGKWHVAKVMLVDLEDNTFNIEVSPRKESRPINILPGQDVGLSMKYKYGKFIFGTKVTGFNPPKDRQSGGLISLAIPEQIELVQRRSYFRVSVPTSMEVDVSLWHRFTSFDYGQVAPDYHTQGRLVDISAGGAQVSIDVSQQPDFRKGQFVGLKFTPMPHETPLMFNAQVRDALPSADEKHICLGLQVVGLEASPEGRLILQRLCNTVDQYYQLNQAANKAPLPEINLD